MKRGASPHFSLQMVKKISKNDIGNPTPLINAALQKSIDSAVDIHKIDNSINRGEHCSVSVVGGPKDPRNAIKEPKSMNLMQYQTFVQAVCSYKRQIQAMSAATETFVRQLQELAECAPPSIID